MILRKNFNILFLLMVMLTLTACNFLKPELTEIPYPYMDDAQMWKHILNPPEQFAFDSKPLGVIVPYDMSTYDNMSQFYKGLSSVVKPKTIFVIAPNQSNSGEFNIQTCNNCVFNTINGVIELNDEVIEKISNENVAKVSNKTFLNEASIYTQTPFIKHNFPNSKIVPIIIKNNTTTEELEKFSSWIENNINDNSLVIASINFSQYLPKEISDFHDLTAETNILNFDFDNFFNLDLKSPETLYAFMNIMKRHGFKKGKLIARTNQNDFITKPLAQTTSHLFFEFSEGLSSNEDGVSILTLGDNHNVGGIDYFAVMKNFNFAKTEESTISQQEKQLDMLRAKEDRFFKGSDFTVFNVLNPNDEFCTNESKNNIKISFCHFTENPDDKDLYNTYNDIIKSQKENSDLVYVMFDFDPENTEIDKNRIKELQRFAKSGMDIMVGRGLEGIYPFLKLKNSIIFPSLGDLLKDDTLALDLSASSEGVALGIYATENEFKIFPFFIDIKNGHPSLKNDTEKKADFFDFSSSAKLHRTNDLIDFYNKVITIKR